MSTIAVLGALGTKGAEFQLLIESLRARAHSPVLVDTSVMGDPPYPPAVAAVEVAEAGGASLETLRRRPGGSAAIQVMANGAARVVMELHRAGRIDGISGMAGSGGTSVFVAAVQGLPVGFPRVLVTTLASGDTCSIVGVKDLVLIPAVVDIAGLNRISRRNLANTAIREELRPDIPLVEMGVEINEPAFARRAVQTLLEMISAR